VKYAGSFCLLLRKFNWKQKQQITASSTALRLCQILCWLNKAAPPKT